MNNLGKKFAKILVSNYSLKEKKEAIKYLKWFQDTIISHEKINNIIFSPAVPTSTKINIINNININIDKINNNEPHTLILKLIKTNKLKMLPDIIAAIELFILEDEGQTKVKVFFAHEPFPKQLSDVESILSKEYKLNPSTQVEVDKSIVAGFIAVFNGRMLDASMHEEFKEIGRIRFE